MRNQTIWRLAISCTAAAFMHPLFAHTAGGNKIAWQACDAKARSEQCSYESGNHDTYRGTCQSMSGELMCVRNQPIEKSAAAASEDNTEADQLHKLEHLFKDATIVSGPSMVDCTLSGGTETRCFSITVKGEPSAYAPGPWCPETISDGPDAGGIWLENGEVNDVDGAFVENLSSFYNDDQWQLYDKVTGKINITDSKESCAAAARPDVEPAYQNHCVQCLPEYMDEGASVTYTIPVRPSPLSDTTQNTRSSGSGIAFNGVRLDGPAPVEDILRNYTIAPFDDCGGHINLNVGYHYHAATDCLLLGQQANDHGTVVGLAMDGRQIYSQFTKANEVPADLDSCRGHSVDDGDYHYHAGEPGGNAILSCLTAEVGCVSENADEVCDAASSAKSGPGGGGNRQGGQGGGPGGPGGPPDLSSAAEKLGVSEAELLKALGGPPPSVEDAAKILNIDLDVLEAALPKPPR